MDASTLQYSLVALMASIGFAPMVYEVIRGRFEPFNLKNIFILYFVIQLGFSGLLTLVSGEASPIGLPPAQFSSAYTQALLLSTVGLFVFQLAYYVGKSRPLPVPALFRRQWYRSRVRLVVFSYLLVGLLAFFLLVNTNGGFAQFLANREEFRAGGLVGQGILLFPATSLMNLAALLYFAHSLQRGKRINPIYPIAVLFISISPAFFLGFRSALMLPVIQFIIIWHFAYKRLQTVYIGSLLAFLGLAFTVYGLSREIPAGVPVSLETAVEVVSNNPEVAYALLSRSKGTEVVASVITKLEATGEYELGWRSLVEAMTIAIPKLIWNDKPTPSSQRFTTYFFAEDLSSSRGYDLEEWGGISATAIGELYWHFGVVGVLVGMFVLGRVAKRVYRTLQHHRSNPSVLIVYAIFFTSFIMFAEAIQGYLNILVLTTPAILFTWLIISRHPQTRRVQELDARSAATRSLGAAASAT